MSLDPASSSFVHTNHPEKYLDGKHLLVTFSTTSTTYVDVTNFFFDDVPENSKIAYNVFVFFSNPPAVGKFRIIGETSSTVIFESADISLSEQTKDFTFTINKNTAQIERIKFQLKLVSGIGSVRFLTNESGAIVSEGYPDVFNINLSGTQNIIDGNFNIQKLKCAILTENDMVSKHTLAGVLLVDRALLDVGKEVTINSLINGITIISNVELGQTNQLVIVDYSGESLIAA